MAYSKVYRTKSIPIIRSHADAKEFIKCSENAFYFILNYVKIIHPLKGTIKFNLYDFQVQALKYIMLNRYSISLKPRQMGMSTLMAAYLLWYAMFNRHKNILIISIKLNVAKSFLNKIRGMYSRLPNFLQMEILNGQESAGTSTTIIFANGSEIHVSAATSDAGRSEALSFLLLDEVAFQKNASHIWGAAQPTLSTGGKACMISTAYGMGNLFHLTWVDAVAGVNSFFPIKLNWRMHPDRDDAWYENEKKILKEKRTAQEVDCDFLKSGYNVFDMISIRVIEERISETYIVEQHFDGNLLVFHPPQPGINYIIGADVATGRARDYSAFSIIDYNGKECACYKGKLDTRNFGKLLVDWGYRYNTAVLAPEVNAVGEGVIAIVQEYNYPNIYNEVAMTRGVNDLSLKESARYGWYTTSKSRKEMITEMDNDLNEDTIELCNPFFVQEAKTFIYNNQNKAIALGKELGKSGDDMYSDESTLVYTDDSIIAACIANQVRKRIGTYKGILPLYAG
ncbi:MAG: hypothetical protein RLY40_1228 [Pseudomonadota bacterium]|jgi:hypothetical protein